ncbi:MAG: hypothetical protein RR931_01080 [Mucinivorans sp.]
METLANILSRERDNQCAIYLYECGTQWCAYERSAYYFYQLFHMGYLCQTEHYLYLSLSQQFLFLDSEAMRSVDISSVDNEAIRLDCRTVFGDFQQWKAQLIF